ncbi:hypothetical protein DSM26151_14920 [Agromyces marinus]|nr:hypothetical protein DSM26151_14920 [Agromyces marinus]
MRSIRSRAADAGVASAGIRYEPMGPGVRLVA